MEAPPKIVLPGEDMSIQIVRSTAELAGPSGVMVFASSFACPPKVELYRRQACPPEPWRRQALSALILPLFAVPFLTFDSAIRNRHSAFEKANFFMHDTAIARSRTNI
jgi:hypothetical protein